MAPWEIWTYDFEDEQTHPVVIFSNSVRVANPSLERVNVLFCTTMRGHKEWNPKPHEVILAEFLGRFQDFSFSAF